MILLATRKLSIIHTVSGAGPLDLLICVADGKEGSFTLVILWIVCDLNNCGSFSLPCSVSSVMMGIRFELSRRGLPRNEDTFLFNFPNKAAEDEKTDDVLDNVFCRLTLLVCEVPEKEHGATEEGTRTTEKIRCAPKWVSQSG